MLQSLPLQRSCHMSEQNYEHLQGDRRRSMLKSSGKGLQGGCQTCQDSGDEEGLREGWQKLHGNDANSL